DAKSNDSGNESDESSDRRRKPGTTRAAGTTGSKKTANKAANKATSKGTSKAANKTSGKGSSKMNNKLAGKFDKESLINMIREYKKQTDQKVQSMNDSINQDI